MFIDVNGKINAISDFNDTPDNSAKDAPLPAPHKIPVNRPPHIKAITPTKNNQRNRGRV